MPKKRQISTIHSTGEKRRSPVEVIVAKYGLAGTIITAARQTLMRSNASGASSTFSLFRAIATTFSIVSDEPSRMMVMGFS